MFSIDFDCKYGPNDSMRMYLLDVTSGGKVTLTNS